MHGGMKKGEILTEDENPKGLKGKVKSLKEDEFPKGGRISMGGGGGECKQNADWSRTKLAYLLLLR